MNSLLQSLRFVHRARKKHHASNHGILAVLFAAWVNLVTIGLRMCCPPPEFDDHLLHPTFCCYNQIIHNPVLFRKQYNPNIAVIQQTDLAELNATPRVMLSVVAAIRSLTKGLVVSVAIASNPTTPVKRFRIDLFGLKGLTSSNRISKSIFGPFGGR